MLNKVLKEKILSLKQGDRNSLTLDGCNDTMLKEAIKFINKKRVKIHHLYCNNSRITDTYPISSLKDLVHLDVSGSKFLSKFDGINMCPNLTTLIAINCNLRSIRSLEYSRIETLNIRKNRVGGLYTITTMPNIQEVSASYNCIKSLPFIPSTLHTLKVGYNYIEDIKGVNNSNIVELDLQGNSIYSFERITLPKLKSLTVYDNPFRTLNGLIDYALQVAGNVTQNMALRQLAHYFEYEKTIDYNKQVKPTKYDVPPYYSNYSVKGIEVLSKDQLLAIINAEIHISLNMVIERTGSYTDPIKKLITPEMLEELNRSETFLNNLNKIWLK
jgi:hypothetical protein